MKPLILAFANSISDISTQAWNTVMGTVNPFCRHEFLLALEQSRSACVATGWIPRHLCVFDASSLLNDKTQCQPLDYRADISQQSAEHYKKLPLLAVMPLYQKSHSYGEYVFDWAWAEAYERHGLDYYPKWVNAIPFTPVQGPRIGITPELENIEQTRIGELMLRALDQRLMHGTGEIQISSWHSLFVAPAQMPLFGASSTQLVKRLGTQFHWYNRDYRNFDDFLSRFSSRKRKNILKERAQLQPFGLKFEFVEGERVTELQWQTFIQCYQLTYLKRSGHRGYLTLAFFHQLGQLLAAQILLLVVKDAKGEMIAGALYFKGKNPQDQKCLYGRYWGTTVELDGLHFEACYYQGIQYCIEHEFQVFDAGAQGEHKVLRGFEPVVMYSYHNIAHLGFKAAIADFVEQETLQMQQYMAQMQDVLPYKKEPS
ncbi:GNAT family N-acetyltransferase [Shewanella putrefaciens]|uniref:GNAT family N-acetyltransferase n=1 Tax=Shewanella putrefaciens TaxID=24 RepID=UPI0021C100A9|nr:GNAT family N-acetyltransferase [Shewanella putrefaciens]MCT8942021.1 GNAT family N-acetyltransferase [Shewanella putrefaciens]